MRILLDDKRQPGYWLHRAQRALHFIKVHRERQIKEYERRLAGMSRLRRFLLAGGLDDLTRHMLETRHWDEEAALQNMHLALHQPHVREVWLDARTLRHLNTIEELMAKEGR
jgi:hypothetical protein